MILVVSAPLSVSIHWGSLVPPTCCSSTMYLVMPPLGYSGTCQESLMAVSDTDSAKSDRGEEGPGTRRGECQPQGSCHCRGEHWCEDGIPWMAMATKAVPGLRDLQGPLVRA